MCACGLEVFAPAVVTAAPIAIRGALLAIGSRRNSGEPPAPAPALATPQPAADGAG